MSAARQRGVGLIEILLATVLVSIGFLAAARMQVESMRFSRGAYHQSQAYLIAADIIDRMRANPRGVAQGRYATPGEPVSMAADWPDPGCHGRPCDAREIAAQDLHDWSGHVHDVDGEPRFVPALPGSAEHPAGATITANPGAGNTYTVTVAWSEVIGRDDTAQTLRVDVAL